MISRWTAMFLLACGTSSPETEGPAPAALPPAPVAPVPAPVTPSPAAGEHGGHGDHDAAPAAAPSTLPETVAALKSQRDQIKALVDTGKLSDIHPLTEQMGKLAVLLPVRARDLPTADKAAVTIVAADIKKILDALHHAADEGSADETRAELARLDEHLLKLPTHE